MWPTYMFRGALAALLGVCALFWPSATLGLIVVLVGVFCFIDGATGLLGAYRSTRGGPYLPQAILSLAIGLILLFWPDATVRVLLVVFGAWLVFSGASQLVMARQGDLPGNDRSILMTIGGVAALIGLILIVWPGSGVVAISWIISIVAFAVAGLFIFLAIRLKRMKERGA